MNHNSKKQRLVAEELNKHTLTEEQVEKMPGWMKKILSIVGGNGEHGAPARKCQYRSEIKKRRKRERQARRDQRR